MADDGLTIALRVADLSLDEEGRVTIRDPQMAELITAAMERQSAAPIQAAVTNNCHGGNCVAGCGTKPK